MTTETENRSTIPGLPERLAAQQDAFSEARANSGALSEWPDDGDYQGIVKRFDFFESKKGEAFLKTEIEVAFDREWAGTPVETIHSLEDPERFQYLKGHLKTLGADVDELNLSTLATGEALDPLLDTPVAIAIRTSEQKNDAGENYRNVYVNKRLGEPGSVVGGPMSGGKVQTDVPADEEGLGDEASERDDTIPF